MNNYKRAAIIGTQYFSMFTQLYMNFLLEKGNINYLSEA